MEGGNCREGKRREKIYQTYFKGMLWSEQPEILTFGDTLMLLGRDGISQISASWGKELIWSSW